MVWLLSMLVFECDLVLTAENAKYLRIMTECFYKVCLKIGLRINVAKGRIMAYWGQNETMCNIEI